MEEHAGVDIHRRSPSKSSAATRDEHGVPGEDVWRTGKLVLEIYEKTTEANISDPMFVSTTPAMSRRCTPAPRRPDMIDDSS